MTAMAAQMYQYSTSIESSPAAPWAFTLVGMLDAFGPVTVGSDVGETIGPVPLSGPVPRLYNPPARAGGEIVEKPPPSTTIYFPPNRPSKNETCFCWDVPGAVERSILPNRPFSFRSKIRKRPVPRLGTDGTTVCPAGDTPGAGGVGRVSVTIGVLPRVGVAPGSGVVPASGWLFSHSP